MHRQLAIIGSRINNEHANNKVEENTKKSHHCKLVHKKYPGDYQIWALKISYFLDVSYFLLQKQSMVRPSYQHVTPLKNLASKVITVYQAITDGFGHK